MNNPDNLRKVHTFLGELNPRFTIQFDDFQRDMGLNQEAFKKKEPTTPDSSTPGESSTPGSIDPSGEFSFLDDVGQKFTNIIEGTKQLPGKLTVLENNFYDKFLKGAEAIGIDTKGEQAKNALQTAQALASVEDNSLKSKPTQGIIESVESGDPEKIAAAAVGAVMSLADSGLKTLASAGTYPFAEAMSSNYYNTLQETAEQEGKSPLSIFMSDEDKEAIPIAAGALSGALEKIGLDKVGASLLKQMPMGMWKRAIDVSKSSGTEGATEFLQSIIEQVSGQVANGKDIDIAWEEAFESAAQGVVGGGLITAPKILMGGNQRQTNPEEGQQPPIQESPAEGSPVKEQNINAEQANEQIIQEAEQTQMQSQEVSKETQNQENPEQPTPQTNETTVDEQVNKAPEQATQEVAVEEPQEQDAATPELNQPTIIKRGNNEYQIKNENGALSITNPDGSNPSPKTIQRVTRDYESQYDYISGDKAPDPGALEPKQYDGYIAEMSNNPAEIAEAWQQSKANGNTEISFKDQVIGEAIGTVSRKQFVDIVGEANIGTSLAKTYLRKDGQQIDTLAQDLSETHGIEVTPQDIADFILDNPNGFNPNRNTEGQQALVDKFRTLTGLNLNERTAGLAIDQMIENEAIKNGIAEKSLQKFIEKEYESEEQIRKEWERENLYTQKENLNELKEVSDTQTIEGKDKAFNTDRLGIAGSDRLIQGIGDFISNAKKDFKKYLSPSGLLPKNVFSRKIKMDSGINSEVRQVKYTSRRLKKELKNQPSDVIEKTDRALKGEIPLSQIPDNIIPVVKSMRDHVDALSKKLIDEGVIQGDLQAKVSDNLGVYLNRSYRVHDDPKGWSKKLEKTPEGQMIRNKAVNFIRGQYPGISESQVEGIINELLYQEDAPVSILTGSKLGSKDLSVLRKRKDIAPEIRALLGEYRDPLVNYSRSVIKMTHLIGKHKFLRDVKDMGLNDFLFEAPTKSHYVKIAGDSSQTMNPINGLYTTPEIAEAFKEFDSSEGQHGWFEVYMKLNGFVKMGKTVGSLQTHARNIVGNFFFVTMNGHWRLGKIGDSLKSVMSDIGVNNNSVWQQKYKEYLRLGVVYDNASSGELRAILKDVNESPDIEHAIEGMYKKIQRKVFRGVTSAYQAEDDFFKILAFENEYARYKKVMRNMPDESIREHAADIVRKTYPTYSLVPKLVKSFRQFPLFGTFVSFPAEVLRTTYNTFALARHEISNPETRGIGLQRVSGILLSASIPLAMQAYSMYDSGVDEEDDKNLENFVPPWGKNGDRIYIRDNKVGRYSYVDLSYSDPHNYIKQPFKGFMSSLSNLQENNKEKAIEEAGESIKQLLEPFLSEEILSGRLIDVSRNITDSGQQIYNPQDNIGQILLNVYNYIAGATEIGTVRSFRRILKGLEGETGDYYKEYDPVDEILALFTGQRIERLSLEQNMYFKMRNVKKELQEAKGIYNKVAYNKGKVDPSDLDSAYERANKARKKILEQAREDVKKAVELGLPINKIEDILFRQTKLSKKDIAVIAYEYDYTPFPPVRK